MGDGNDSFLCRARHKNESLPWPFLTMDLDLLYLDGMLFSKTAVA